jgi:aspartate/methionine/tyrosine aminotransferase
MKIAPFTIEEYYAQYEFSVPYNLSASDCETMSVSELLQLAQLSIDDLGRLKLGYTESQGHPLLREAISGTYEDVSPEEIVVLGAPEEGVYVTMRTLLSPGDEVVVMAPAYDSLRNVAEHICGADGVKAWQVRPGAEGWHLALEELEQLLTRQTALLIVNFPHNPTGYVPDREMFAALLDVCRRHNLRLFCDEMYRGLETGDTMRLPSAVDRYERGLVLSGLSKVYGLPGLRSGWLVIRDADVRAELINWKHYTTICAPAPSEFLALAALQARETLADRSRALVEENMQVAEAFFARHSALFTWRRPQAGSVALVGVDAPSADDFCQQLIEEAGVLLLPGTRLGAGDGHVRFGLGRADFAENLAHLESYLVEKFAGASAA